MRISTITLQNFRCFGADAVTIELTDLAARFSLNTRSASSTEQHHSVFESSFPSSFSEKPQMYSRMTRSKDNGAGKDVHSE